jgi:hypothetical protein
MLAKDAARRAGSAYSCLMEMDSIMNGLPRDLLHSLSSWFRSVRKELPMPTPPAWKKRTPPFAWLASAAGFGLIAGFILKAIL